MQQVLHAIECAAHRDKFAPLVLTTDTWPASHKVYHAQWLSVIGRIGAFQGMKRILDSLHPAHKDLQAARKALSQKVYAHSTADEVWMS